MPGSRSSGRRTGADPHAGEAAGGLRYPRPALTRTKNSLPCVDAPASWRAWSGSAATTIRPSVVPGVEPWAGPAALRGGPQDRNSRSEEPGSDCLLITVAARHHDIDQLAWGDQLDRGRVCHAKWHGHRTRRTAGEQTRGRRTVSRRVAGPCAGPRRAVSRPVRQGQAGRRAERRAGSGWRRRRPRPAPGRPGDPLPRPTR